jgi:hypothetical protein
MQNGEGIRSSITVQQGGVINVDVGPNDSTVEMSVDGSGHATSTSVPPGKQVSIPVPDVPPGTLLHVTVGRGNRTRFILVEVIAPE